MFLYYKFNLFIFFYIILKFDFFFELDKSI
jgi:hypothetical protein